MFICYTMRDSYINEKLFLDIQEGLEFNYYLFIDAINNDSDDKQERVIRELMMADVIIVINSKSIEESSWAQHEISLAKIHNKKIIMVDCNIDTKSCELVKHIKNELSNNK